MSDEQDEPTAAPPERPTRRAVMLGAAGGLAAVASGVFSGTASAQTTEVPPHAETHEGGSDDLSGYFARLGGYNVFSADQVIHARLGIGTDPFFPLHVVQPGTDIAAQIKGEGQALALHQTRDWAGDVVDTMNIFHRSTGDGIFTAHFGGRPPGYAGPTGGNAAFNALVPYHLDTAADDYSGSVVNDRQGMTGLRIATQPPNPGVTGISILHQGQEAAIGIHNQDPAHPQGHGFGIYVDNWSNRAAISVQMRGAAPVASALRVLDFTGSAPTFPLAGTQPGAIHLVPSSGVNGNSLAITFGGILGSGSVDSRAQAGLYSQSAGAYGTKMYLATTNDFSKGAQARVIVDAPGRVGIKQMQPAAMLHVEPNGASDRLLLLKTAAGQTGNQLELRDSTDAVVGRIDKSGYFMTRKRTAPADADLANSELAIWLDDSPGQTQVMFKAKDSAGKVRTASVKLV